MWPPGIHHTLAIFIGTCSWAVHRPRHAAQYSGIGRWFGINWYGAYIIVDWQWLSNSAQVFHHWIHQHPGQCTHAAYMYALHQCCSYYSVLTIVGNGKSPKSGCGHIIIFIKHIPRSIPYSTPHLLFTSHQKKEKLSQAGFELVHAFGMAW